MPSPHAQRTAAPRRVRRSRTQAGALAALTTLALLPLAPTAHAQATPPGPMTWTYGYDAEGKRHLENIDRVEKLIAELERTEAA